MCNYYGLRLQGAHHVRKMVGDTKMLNQSVIESPDAWWRRIMLQGMWFAGMFLGGGVVPWEEVALLKASHPSSYLHGILPVLLGQILDTNIANYSSSSSRGLFT